jgi:hypothetical protein
LTQTEVITEVSVEQFQTRQETVHAVEFDGDTHTARALIEHKWLDGCANGFDRDGAHEVLRGLVGAAIVYPGDMIIHHKDGTVEVLDGDTFDKHYKETGKSETLEANTAHTYAGEVHEEPEPLGVEAVTIKDPSEPSDEKKLLDAIPSGENPNAVNLEPEYEDDDVEEDEDDEDLDEDEEDDEE